MATIRDSLDEKSILIVGLEMWVNFFYEKLNFIMNNIKGEKKRRHPLIDFSAIFILFFSGVLFFFVPEAILSSASTSANLTKGLISIFVNILDDSILATMFLYATENINELVKKYVYEGDTKLKSKIYLDFLNRGFKTRVVPIAIPTLFGLGFIGLFSGTILDIPDYDLFADINTSVLLYAKLYIIFFKVADSFITGYAVGLSICLSLLVLMISLQLPLELSTLLQAKGGTEDLGNSLMESHVLFLIAIVAPIFLIDILDFLILKSNSNWITNDVSSLVTQLENGTAQVIAFYMLYMIVLFIFPLYMLHRRIDKVKKDTISEIANKLSDSECKIKENETNIGTSFTKSLYLLSLHERISSLNTWPIDIYLARINVIFSAAMLIFSALPFIK